MHYLQWGGGCVHRSYPLRPNELYLEYSVKCAYDAAISVVFFFFHFYISLFAEYVKPLKRYAMGRGIVRTSHCVVPNFIKQTANNDTLTGPGFSQCVQTSLCTDQLTIQFVSRVRNRISNEISCFELRLPELIPKRRIIQLSKSTIDKYLENICMNSRLKQEVPLCISMDARDKCHISLE